MAFLLWIRDEDRQLRFPLGDVAELGRSSECSVQILAPTLSRRHAAIRRTGDDYTLEDTDSHSGTYLNGSLVRLATTLSPGDSIRLGGEHFVFDPPVDVLRAPDSPQQIYLFREKPAPETERLDSVQSGPLADLQRLSRRLLSELDTPELLENLVDELRLSFAADRCVIVGRTSKSPGWRALAMSSDTGKVAVSLSLLNLVTAEGVPMTFEDATGDVQFRGSESVVEHSLRSVMAVPIRSGDEIVAVAQIDRGQRGAYGQPELARFAALADVAGVALANAARRVHSTAGDVPSAGSLVGDSEALRHVVTRAAQAADSDARVLIGGESGTGKELVARYIHDHSQRANGPWVAINCAALPTGLIDSELFGHEEGSFSGAQARHRGCFERADGGTLFLDEVGELAAETQAKLLRAVQEGRFYRVGGEHPIDVDVRVIAASHRNLRSEVDADRFREDLYYRLRIVDIEMPALRERPEDIPVLTRHFFAELSSGREAPLLSPQARERWQSYRWPGNVRELRNAVERLVVLYPGALVETEHLPAEMQTSPHPGRLVGSLADALAEVERDMITIAVKKSGGNKSQAARMLGISRPTLDKKLKKFGLEPRSGS